MTGLNSTRLLLVACLVSLFYGFSFSEGTREIRPSETDTTFVAITVDPSRGANFAYLNGPVNNRLNIHICNIGEKVFLGFGKNNNIQFRIIDPNGLVVSSSTITNPNASQMNPLNTAAGIGLIQNYTQAILGPKNVAAGGYEPYSFTATKTGDYYIEFLAANTNPSLTTLSLIDITVVGTDNLVKPGRLWSKAWSLYTGGFEKPFLANLYIYSNDQIVTKVDMNGIKPAGFVVSANDSGTDSTGNYLLDRKSVTGNKTYPLYKIFLNDPDSVCYPSGVIGSFDGKTTITGCAGDYCINAKLNAQGSYQVEIELNGVLGFQAGTKDRLLSGNATKGNNCIKWNGLDGLGNAVVDKTKISVSIKYQNGLTHLPIYDVESHSNGYVVTYVRPKPSVPDSLIEMFWDDGSISYNGANGQVNTTNGCKNKNGCHIWNSTPVNTSNSIGDAQTINTWWYIKNSSDSVSFVYNYKDIDANRNTSGKGKFNDSSICASTKKIRLNGSITGEKSVKWTILKGSGTFENDTLLRTNYVPSKADSALSSISFLLSTAHSACAEIHDTISFHIEPVPSLKLNAPASVCFNNPSISLSYTFANAKSAAWIGNGGKFSPDSLTASSVYTPDSTELNFGTIVLKGRTLPKSAQLCAMVSDSVKITVYNAPKISIPADTILCRTSSITSLSLAGKADIVTDSLVWRSTGISPVPKLGLNTSFSITQNTPFKIFLTGYKKGCLPVSDSLDVSFKDLPKMAASVKDTCMTQEAVVLKGNIQFASTKISGTWSSNGTGFFVSPKDSINHNIYFPSKEEIAHGNVSFKLKSISSSTLCSAPDTTILWTIVPLPQAKIGKSDTVCANSSVTKTAQITNISWKYEWKLGNILMNNISNVSFVAKQDTLVKLKVTNSLGCEAKDSVPVKIVLYPKFHFTAKDLCPNESGSFNVNLTKPSLSSKITRFKWLLNNQELASASWQKLAYRKAGTYRLELFIGSCQADSSVIIKQKPNPKIDIPLVYKYCHEFDESLSLQSNPFAKYKWLSEEGNLIDTTQTIAVKPEKDTHYQLFVANEFSCKDSTKVLVRKVCPPRLFVPNVITPESQDVNSALHIFGANYINFEITIFSRWGEVIFNTKDDKNAWNGVYKGENMPIGNYQWQVTYEGDSEEYKGPYKKTGDVTVVR